MAEALLVDRERAIKIDLVIVFTFRNGYRSERIVCAVPSRSGIDPRIVRAVAAAGEHYGDAGHAVECGDGNARSLADQLRAGAVPANDRIAKVSGVCGLRLAAKIHLAICRRSG